MFNHNPFSRFIVIKWNKWNNGETMSPEVTSEWNRTMFVSVLLRFISFRLNIQCNLKQSVRRHCVTLKRIESITHLYMYEERRAETLSFQQKTKKERKWILKINKIASERNQNEMHLCIVHHALCRICWHQRRHWLIPFLHIRNHNSLARHSFSHHNNFRFYCLRLVLCEIKESFTHLAQSVIQPYAEHANTILMRIECNRIWLRAMPINSDWCRWLDFRFRFVSKNLFSLPISFVIFLVCAVHWFVAYKHIQKTSGSNANSFWLCFRFTENRTKVERIPFVFRIWRMAWNRCMNDWKFQKIYAFVCW